MTRYNHPLIRTAAVSLAAINLFSLSICGALAASPPEADKPPAATTAPAGQLTLSDGHVTINFNLPDGFTESEPSAANHRTLKAASAVTQLTLLPPDQPTDAGAAI